MGLDSTAVVALCISFFCPPLAVAYGIPGYVHAWYLVYVYLDNKKLLQAPEGGRPFVFSERLQQISTVNRSTASLPAPRTSTETVPVHRRNPAVQQNLAQEQKPVPETKPATEKTSTPEPKPTASARPTPVSTPGPSAKPTTGLQATQTPSARPTPTPSPPPLTDNRDAHSPKTKD
ncbi:hypothetical protein B0T21DRAFT_382742 [Apiosordaria backusii]|uniref:Uncharacterized protein n=1 Tax=Apiosordaria backusii TaxID=314023 RepID=A0AA40EIT3_9PEZI|nr:hypothetical protein B0T21DRAFT_382742 [Apiosordaria backusii]